MDRIRVSYQIGGAGTIYPFAINPSEFDTIDEPNKVRQPILHGAAAYQNRAFDDRPRTMTWRGFYASSQPDSVFKTQLTEMRSWEGTIKWFQFRDILLLNYRWPSTASWVKVRVIGINTEVKQGGTLRYEKVELVIQPEV